jgi:hypothetical protein
MEIAEQEKHDFRSLAGTIDLESTRDLYGVGRDLVAAPEYLAQLAGCEVLWIRTHTDHPPMH